MKTLISYKPIVFARLVGDSFEFPYELTIQHSYLFGLIKFKTTIRFNISMFSSIKDHTNNWDALIKNKTKIQ